MVTRISSQRRKKLSTAVLAVKIIALKSAMLIFCALKSLAERFDKRAKYYFDAVFFAEVKIGRLVGGWFGLGDQNLFCLHFIGFICNGMSHITADMRTSHIKLIMVLFRECKGTK